MPSALSPRRIFWICCTTTGASPSEGSSSRRSVGPARSTRAMASICCSPPDSLAPLCSARASRAGNASVHLRDDQPFAFHTGGSSRFSLTVSVAKIARSSGT